MRAIATSQALYATLQGQQEQRGAGRHHPAPIGCQCGVTVRARAHVEGETDSSFYPAVEVSLHRETGTLEVLKYEYLGSTRLLFEW